MQLLNRRKRSTNRITPRAIHLAGRTVGNGMPASRHQRAVYCIAYMGSLWAPFVASAVDYNDFPLGLRQILDERIAVLDADGGMCVAGLLCWPASS